MNLPPGAAEIPSWAGLHDAQIVSIHSNLLERTVTLHLESDHLLEFHKLPLDLQFLLRLEGVRSARVVHYAVWPGKFSIPAGTAREEEARLIGEYQSKCREESLSWSELESAVTMGCKQVIDIADATLATATDNSMALRISGLLNYTSYRELFSYFCARSGSRFPEAMGRSWELQDSSRWERHTGMRSSARKERTDAQPEMKSDTKVQLAEHKTQELAESFATPRR